MRKGRSEVCDEMRFRVGKEAGHQFVSRVQPAWRHRRRQAVTTKLGTHISP